MVPGRGERDIAANEVGHGERLRQVEAERLVSAATVDGQLRSSAEIPAEQAERIARRCIRCLQTRAMRDPRLARLAVRL